jgi:hypothetical protein
MVNVPLPSISYALLGERGEGFSFLGKIARLEE